MRGGEEAAVFAILHVFAVGFEHCDLAPICENT
jgi:hypothetical protein